MLERIKALCTQHKTTVTELENILGIGRGTILKWDVSSPNMVNLVKVAQHFDVSLEYLVGIETEYSEAAMHIAKRYDNLSPTRKTLVDHYLDAVEQDEKVVAQ